MISIGEMRVYTTDEVALILRRADETIREWLRAGIIVGVKRGGRWYITESELQRVMTPQR